MCLLLRADAEQCWLHREVIPVLRELEDAERLDGQDVAAALAYLEAMWEEAEILARASDAAHGRLRCAGTDPEGHLHSAAGSYHAAVRVLREIVATRVARLVHSATDGLEAELGGHAGLSRAQAADGCAPRAA
jgi:hypothetical protein